MTVEQMSHFIAEAQLQEAQRTARVRSKIYGYTFDEEGTIVVVPEEARVIQQIFSELNTITLMSCSRILEEIAKDFRTAESQVRNRSGRLWLPSMLLRLSKNSTYAALELDSWGRYVKISNYPPIVSESQFKTTIKRLKREGLA